MSHIASNGLPLYLVRYQLTWEGRQAVGRALRARAARAKVSPHDIARKAGCHHETVWRLFAGGRVSWETAERIAAALHTTVVDALREDAETPGRSR